MNKLSALLAITLLTAGCTAAGSSAGQSPNGSSYSPAIPASGHHAYQTDATKPVLKIVNSGGFTGPGYQLTIMPTFALYGDGRVVVPGATDAMYPGPLLPNLRELRVTPDDIARILIAAETAGLLGPDASYNQANITDVGTTVFTTSADGATHVISAYALTESTETATGPEGTARAKLRDFEAKVLDLSNFLGRSISDAAYQPASMRIYTTIAATLDSAGPSPQELVWPIAADPATAGQPSNVPGLRCLAIDGSDLAAFMKAASTARANTVWTAPSGRYSVSVRPLYPDESGCPTTAN